MPRSHSIPRGSRPRLLVALSTAMLLLAGATHAQEAERVSEFGRYEGYSEAVYDGHVRESFYITMPDGVKLACDLYRPTRGGELHQEALPLVWTHHRYHRSSQRGNIVFGAINIYSWLRDMLHHGYLVAAVDVRGGGASFGNWTGIFNDTETQDAYDIIEWFAEQEWCDGNIGMYGGSYLGGTQLMAASRMPEALKAVFPFVALFEQYDIIWDGGIYRDDLCQAWSDLTRQLDLAPVVAAVDGPDGRRQRTAAQKEHGGNLLFEPNVRARPFRDSTGGHPDFTTYDEGSPLSYIAEIEESEVAVYHQAGWFDTFPREAFLMYNNLANPQRMVIGPWFHTDSFGVDWSAEFRRWFDHWLKGFDNGVMDGDPIYYYVMGAPEDEAWQSTPVWPLAEEQRTAYYLHDGPSGSIESLNDGLLSPTPLADGEHFTEVTVDYTTTSGKVTRWSAAVGQAPPNASYQDMAANDARGLTFTTPPLEQAIEVTGHPVMHLWVSTTADDGDFFVYLEEVTPDGGSEYVSEGCLRASHRSLDPPPHERFGVPYHGHRESDVLPVTDEPMELVFDLHPTSNIFDAGHRIRIAIANADVDNADTPVIEPAPQVRLYQSATMPSRVVLPIIPARTAEDS